jgi:hypothetical protein
MNTTPRPEVDDPGKPLPAEEEKPGTNEVQHQPNPRAEPMPDGDPKYRPSSPYTHGND